MSDDELFKLSPKLNDRTQSLASKIAKADTERETTRIKSEMQMRSEYEGQMLNAEQHLNALNPQQYRDVDTDNDLARHLSNGVLDAKGYRTLKDKVPDYKTQQSEAPTIARISQKFGESSFEALKSTFAADPDLKAMGDLDKLSEDLEGDTPAQKIASFVKLAVKALHAHERPGIVRQLNAEMKAQVTDGVAALAEGLPEPVLVGAGVGANGSSTMQQAVNRAADTNYDMTPADWHNYDLGVAAGLHPIHKR